MISKMVEAVENIEHIALEREKAATKEAKEIIKTAENEAKRLIEREVASASTKAEEFIRATERMSQKTLSDNLKKIGIEMQHLKEEVQVRKKSAVKAVIELVMD